MTIARVETIEESKAISRLAVQVFGPVSWLIVPGKPKWAYHAKDENGELLGGLILKKLGEGVGVVEWIFVAKAGRGQGLGPKLLDVGVQALEDAGCSKQLALVRDDNTPSWNMFAKRGYKVPSLFRAYFGGSFVSFLTMLGITFANTGYSIWVREPGESEATANPERRVIRRGGGWASVLFTLLVAVSVGRFGRSGTDWLLAAGTLVAGTTLLRMILMYPIARAYGPVEFRLSHGGMVFSLAQGLLGTWWPQFGFWAPKEPWWHFSSFRTYESVGALVGWIITLSIYPASFLLPLPTIAAGIRALVIAPLIYQAIPTFPFEGMDGYRVFVWNKWLYAAGLIATLATFAHAIFF